jgi:hypothetical protein
MKRVKAWAVLGAAKGLGPVTIKYLLSRNQAVLAVEDVDPMRLCDALKVFTGCHGPIDILIDNLAYNLVDDLTKTTSFEVQIGKSLRETLDAVRLILPYMGSGKKVVSIPPKPCLLMDSGEPVYDERSDAVQLYCNRLKKELLILDNKIAYLASKGTHHYGANNSGK